MSTLKKNALQTQGGVVNALSTGGDPISKIDRVLLGLRSPGGLNRFDAELLGDHTLNSTIASLRERGVRIDSCWEVVPTRYTERGVRVMRYWARSV